MVTESSILRSLKNLPTVLQHFYLHYMPRTCKIKFSTQIVTTAFSNRSKSGQDSGMNCDVTKSKSWFEQN